MYEEDGEIKVQFRKKVKLEDIIGTVTSKEKTDAVKLKKWLKEEKNYKDDGLIFVDSTKEQRIFLTIFKIILQLYQLILNNLILIMY